MERVKVWKRSSETFLRDLYEVQRCVEALRGSYFDGHEPLFACLAEAFKQISESAERLAEAYNSCFVTEMECQGRLLESQDSDTGKKDVLGPFFVDLESLRCDSSQHVKERVKFLADRARAEAHDYMGDNRQASDLMKRHL